MQFTIWLIYECNMRCTYCYEGKEKASGKMDLNTAKDVLEFIKKKIKNVKGIVNIQFHGGEPLLNYEILTFMIEEIKKWNRKGISMFLTTNATLLNDDKISYLTDNLDELSVNIDGKEKTHNLNRKFLDNRGSYQVIIANVKKVFAKNNCNIIARMTITPETSKYLYENVEYLIKLGAKKILPVVDQFNNDWDEYSMNLVLEEIKKIYDNIYLTIDNISIGIIENLKYRKESMCLAGEKTMHISPYGNIYPCAYVMDMDKFLLGDVKNGLDIDKVKKLNEANKKMIEDCRSCTWKKMCNGNRCKLLNYAVTGNLYKPAFSTCMNEHLLLKTNEYCKIKAII